MFRGVVSPFLVVVVVVVVSVGSSLAAPPLPYSFTHQELAMTLIVNQLAILKVMNESTSLASHDDELDHLRKEMENEWQAMNETVVEGMNDMNEVKHKIEGMNGTLREVSVLSEKLENEIERLNENRMTATEEVNDKIGVLNHTLQTGISALSETMKNEIQMLSETGESRARTMNEINGKIQAMNKNIQREVREFGEQMENEINNQIDAVNQTVHRGMAEMNEKIMNDTQRLMKLEAVQNASVGHPRPDPDDLYVHHNDTYKSLCDGHKVLYGGNGALRTTGSSSRNYINNMDCSWEVTLPEGSRPVFRWHYFDIEDCLQCNDCDYMYISDMNHRRVHTYCGDNPPDGSFLTIMNNKFKVKFHSDGSMTGRGFFLQYRAVEMN